MAEQTPMRIVTLSLILFTIPVLALSCNRHTASQTVQTVQSDTVEIVLDEPQSELCRVVVNYKNNRHLYVEFGKNGFKPVDAQGTLVKLDDEWGVISIAKFQFGSHRVSSSEFILRMLESTNDILFPIYRPSRNNDDWFLGYKTWNFHCFSYAYHDTFNGLITYAPKYIGDLSKLSIDDTHSIERAINLFFNTYKDKTARNIRLCRQNDIWMVYKNKPSHNYICEATKLDRDLEIIETFGSFITLQIDTKESTCQGNSSEEYIASIQISSNPDDGTLLLMHPFVQTYLSKDLYDNYRNTHSKPASLSLVLFTEGKRQRRSFGVPLDWKDGRITQIAELSETPELLEDILRSIDKAPNGCGSFDWETAELVHKDGKRYSLGAFDSIAGIYWLSPDDELDWSALSSKAEPLVFNDYEYEPPQPMPNCEYFSEAHQAKLKYDERARECGCRLSFTELYHISEKCTTEVYDYFFEHYDDFVDEIEEAEGPNEDLDCGGGS